MLHIATVHFKSPRWIEIQKRYLERYISVPYTTWTSLQGIDPSYGVHFDHVIEQAGGHSGKLNHLATEITHQAEDDDLLMFLDGDAFPVAELMPTVEEGMAKAPLIAVRRSENSGDEQPHPCFCVTTVGTWRNLPGDWSEGYRWTNEDGSRPTDVGGNLLRILELTQTPWVPLLRTNGFRLDPLFFAIYAGVVYHHGAGFRRSGASRALYAKRPKRLLPQPPSPYLRSLFNNIEKARTLPWRLKVRGPQIVESKRVYEMIERDDPGWLSYIA